MAEEHSRTGLSSSGLHRVGSRRADQGGDLTQQKPPASRAADGQQAPCASTARAGPSQSPHASSRPLAQHSARRSSVAPCPRRAPRAGSCVSQVLWPGGGALVCSREADTLARRAPTQGPPHTDDAWNKPDMNKSSPQGFLTTDHRAAMRRTATLYTTAMPGPHRSAAGAAGRDHAGGAAVAGRVQDARAGGRDLAVGPAKARLAHAHAALAHALRGTQAYIISSIHNSLCSHCNHCTEAYTPASAVYVIPSRRHCPAFAQHAPQPLTE